MPPRKEVLALPWYYVLLKNCERGSGCTSLCILVIQMLYKVTHSASQLFCLEHSVFKTKQLRHQERDLAQDFEWLEILHGLFCNQLHHLPIIMELSWYALPSSWMKGQKSTMQVSYSFSFPHDFCTVKFSSHLSQFFIIKSSRKILYYLFIHSKYFFCIKYRFS